MELPRLEPLWRKYRDRGFQVIAVESEGDTERALEFITENDLSYRLVEDVEGEGNVVKGKLDVGAFPTTFLTDRQGRILYSKIGFEAGDEAELETWIGRLLDG